MKWKSVAESKACAVKFYIKGLRVALTLSAPVETFVSFNPFPAVDKYIRSSIFTLRASTFTTCTQLLQSLAGTPSFLLYYVHAPVHTI